MEEQWLFRLYENSRFPASLRETVTAAVREIEASPELSALAHYAEDKTFGKVNTYPEILAFAAERGMDGERLALYARVLAAIPHDAANIYYVVVNSAETQYAVTDVASALAGVYDPAAQETAPQDPFSGISKPTSYSNWSSPTPGPAPEPTSGLLLLLGVAGLALKRKRA